MPTRSSKSRGPQRKRPVNVSIEAHRGDWTVVLLDAAPLRRDAAAEAVAAMRETERLRRELEVFERVTAPEYERWKAQHFGALLTEVRELEMRLHQISGLMKSLQARAYFEGLSLEEAYLRERADEEAFSRQGAAEEVREEDWDENMTEEENAESMAEAFIRDVFGLDPREIPSEMYKEILRGFQRAAAGSPGQEDTQQRNPDAGKLPRTADSLTVRLKELYRQLARRLHPDAGGGGGANDLWHDFQEAHGRGDVERLEILVAVTDLREGVDAASSTLFHLREAAREFRRGVRALGKRLKEARRSPAWRLRRGQAPGAFQHDFGKTLHREKSRLRSNLEVLERHFEQIKSSAAKLARKNEQSPARRRRGGR